VPFLPFHLQDRQCWSARHGYAACIAAMQVQHFFLEHCGDGSWKWHWWLHAPKGGSEAASSTQAGSQAGSSSRPSSKGVWSASTQVNFGG